MTKTTAIAFWLLPVKSAGTIFSRSIRDFAGQFGSPVFQPHVTICVAPRAEAIASLLRALPFSEIELTTRGIKSDDSFTKSFFVQFAKNAALQQLADIILEKVGALESSPVDPHLSLLYGKLSAQRKRSIAASVKLPARVRFDGICAMQCALPVETAADVRAWKLLARRRLPK